MKKLSKAAFILAAMIALCCPAFSRSAQELLEVGHWVYSALTAISLESGTLNFSDSGPLSISELRTYLEDIDYESLSAAGKRQWERIHSYFSEDDWSYDSDFISAGIEPCIRPEGYYKTNDDIDWIYDRYSRGHIIEVPVTFSVADYLTLGTEVHLGENKGAQLHDDNYFNVPEKDTEVDVNFPDYGYLSTGYKFTDRCGASFQLGMGPQSIGRTQTGSIIMSEYMTGASYGKLSLYSPNIKYTYSAIELNVDKYMYYHLFDFRLFKKATVSFMEGTLTNASWELRYANPLTIFHGMAPWRDYNSDDAHNGEFMGVKIDITPVKYLRFYGMFAMNQYQVPYEKREYSDSATPNSLGGQLGLEAFVPAGKGYVHFGLEGYYAQPTLYIKQSPDWSFFRTYTDNIGDNAIFYEWTGSPFGPDTIAGEVSLGYEKPGVWSLDLVYLFLQQGENAEKSIFYDKASRTSYSSTDGDNRNMAGKDNTPDSWPYPKTTDEAEKQTPIGTPKYTNRISLRGKWQAADWLSLTFQPACVVIFNNEHKTDNVDWGLEFALALKCELTKVRGSSR